MPLWKYLQEVFHLKKERFGGFPSHAICATVHIKSTWNFMLLGLYVPCGWSACVHVCAGLFRSFTHSHAKLCTHKNTLAVSSISAVKPDPPRLFSLVIMSKFAQEGRGKGRAMWTCVGVFCFFFLSLLQNPLLITSDLRSLRSKSPSEAFQMQSSKTFLPPCPLFFFFFFSF